MQYGHRRAVNKQWYGWHTVAHQPKTCVCLPYRMVTIFSNSLAELITGLDLDQSGAFRLVFGLNQKAQPRTKPKSEVTHCIMLILRAQIFWVVICSRNRVPGPGSKIHYPVPNPGNWYPVFALIANEKCNFGLSLHLLMWWLWLSSICYDWY